MSNLIVLASIALGGKYAALSMVQGHSVFTTVVLIAWDKANFTAWDRVS